MMKPKIKAKDLKFPIDRLFHESVRNIFERWIMRYVASIILNDGGSYQMCGYTGVLKRSYECVDADCHQLAHWILMKAGYECTCAELMKLTNTDSEKEPSYMTHNNKISIDDIKQFAKDNRVLYASLNNNTFWISLDLDDNADRFIIQIGEHETTFRNINDAVDYFNLSNA